MFNKKCTCSAVLSGYFILQSAFCPVHKRTDFPQPEPSGYEDVKNLPGPGMNVTSGTSHGTRYVASPTLTSSMIESIIRGDSQSKT